MALWLLAPTARSSGHGVLLLTPGITSAQAGRLVEQRAPREVVSLGAQWYEGASLVSSAQAAASRVEQGEALTVAGWGLLPEEWKELGDVQVEFLPSDTPEGIVALEAPTHLAVGAVARLRGKARANAAVADIRVIGPGGVIDSVRVPRDSTSDFELELRAPAQGRFVWQVEFRRAGRRLAVDSIGIEVEAATSLRVLLLERAPSFELNALAGWLGRAGAVVERRTTVSQGREQVSTFNRGAGTTALDSAGLASVDAVVMHDATLISLARRQRGVLEREIRDRGLGAIVLIEGKPSENATTLTAATAKVVGDGASRRTRPLLDGNAPLDDIEAAGIELRSGDVLAHDAQGRALATLHSAGTGRVLLSALMGTDAWRRRGADSTYARWWTRLLQSIQRSNAARDGWQFEQPVRVDRRVGVVLRTLDTLPSRVVVGPDESRDTIAFAPDPADHVTWYSSIWPRLAGWHAFIGPNGSRAFLVGGRGAWSTLDGSRRLTASSAFVRAPSSAGRARIPAKGRGALRLLSLATLVAVLGFLWWDDRRRNQ